MKVLIADDEVVSRRLLESSLRRWGYEVLVAGDGAEAARILLAPEGPKLAVLDWLMPGLDGIQVCQEVRGNKSEPYTYILLLTSKRSQEDIILGLEAGADDYVTKPFDPAELKVRLRTGKRILFLQEQLISAREALRDQATRDQLTGLWNRPMIMDLLSEELNRASREGTSLAVAMADLDNFKAINDTYGHAVGDWVLCASAAAMRDAVRRYDAVGRYGGEEFLILLPGCGEANAMSHAERLRHAVSQVSMAAKDAIRPTVSLGVAISNPSTSRDPIDLLQAADDALYEAKRSGRNRAVLGRVAEPFCAPI